MTVRTLPLLFLTIALIAGCVSQDTSSLRIGMTRAEVVKVMGKPDSVGADGQNEFLNYRLVTQVSRYGSPYASPAIPLRYAPSGSSCAASPAIGATPRFTHTTTFHQPFVVRFVDGRVVAFGTTVQASRHIARLPGVPAGRTTVLRHTPDASTTGVRIVAIEPEAAPAGKPTEFKVRIAYELNDTDAGALILNFNLQQPSNFNTVATTPIARGAGEVEVAVKVTPRDWGAFKGFLANVLLRGEADGNPGKVLAHHNREISVGD